MKKRVLVFVLGAALSSGAALAAPVNVNTAQSAAIARALGVGENIGARIVAEREENGPFKSPEDLQKRVKGLDARAVAKNKPDIKL